MRPLSLPRLATKHGKLTSHALSPSRSVCVTPSDLLVAVQDPPILRIVPFPSTVVPDSSASSSTSRLPTFGKAPAAPSLQRRASGWEGLPQGLGAHEGASDAVPLSEWEWLVGRDRDDGASPFLSLSLSLPG